MLASSPDGPEAPAPPTGAAGRSLRVVNPDPRYDRPHLITPSDAGFLHLAVQTDPQARPGPVRRRDPRRARALALVTSAARAMDARPEVLETSVFRGVLIAPGDAPVRPDVALLARTASPADAATLRGSPELEALRADLAAAGARTHVMAARNERRIADVDHARPGGLFLFNHFRADDIDLTVRLWDHLAAWYQRETGLDNSMLMRPLDGEASDYAVVNHARWDTSLPRLLWHQMSKRTFRTFVLANLRANGVVAIPALYRQHVT